MKDLKYSQSWRLCYSIGVHTRYSLSGLTLVHCLLYIVGVITALIKPINYFSLFESILPCLSSARSDLMVFELSLNLLNACCSCLGKEALRVSESFTGFGRFDVIALS